MFFYLISLLLLLSYILLKKRRFDFFSFASLGLFVYSGFILLGELQGPRDYPLRYISDEVYISFSILIVVVFISALMNDILNISPNISIYSNNLEYSTLRNSSIILWLTIFTILIYLQGVDVVFFSTKRQLMDATGIEITFLNISTTIAAFLCLISPPIKYKILGMGMLVISIFIAHRTPLIYVSLMIAIMLFNNKGKVKFIINNFKIVIIMFSMIMFMALLKPIIAQVRSTSSNVSGLFEYDLVDLLLRGLEFYRTQYLFNEMIVNDFTTDGGHIFRAFYSLLPIPRDFLAGTPSNEFNALFQPILFPDVPGGLANNSIAEQYVYGGYISVAIYSILFGLTIFFMNMLIKHYPRLKLFILFTSVLICFISYRNSLAVNFGFFRNFYIYFVSLYILNLCLIFFSKYFKNKKCL